MNRLGIAAILVGLLIVAGLIWMVGCRRERTRQVLPSSVVLGLQTEAWPTEVAVAVEKANQLLHPDAKLTTEKEFSAGSNDIPLLYTRTSKEDIGGMCYVPRGHRAIVIDAALFGQLDALFAQGNSYSNRQRHEDLLTIMLLHEAGHVLGNAPGSYGSGAKASPNAFTTLSKSEELMADQYAANCINRWKRPEQAFGGPDFARSLTAQMLALCLSTISFNFTTHNAIEHFGSSAVADASVYQDIGYTHPNMNLRVLVLNYFVDPGEHTQKLLDEFVQLRSRHEARCCTYRPRRKSPSDSGGHIKQRVTRCDRAAITHPGS